jgi:transcriptional regulator of arginine metabolism
MKGDRRQRHLKILELVATHPIHTQEELALALSREGWTVTQSSVSRDIASLHLAKVDGAYRPPAAARRLPADPDEQRIAEGVLTIELAGDALLVVHTPPGEANRVGAALDRLAWPEVLGNISGDDTILIAVRNPAGQRRVLGALRRLAQPA